MFNDNSHVDESNQSVIVILRSILSSNLLLFHYYVHGNRGELTTLIARIFIMMSHGKRLSD